METETRKVDFNSVVAKSNELIPQIAKFELSELRLIAYCVAHYDSRKPGNKSFIARIDDLTKLFPMDKKSAYAVIRKVMIGLGKKPLEVMVKKKKRYRNWFEGFDYEDGSGEFEFFIQKDVAPYLLQLEGCFTRFRLKDVYQFKAASTWKLYENLKRWEAAGKWPVKLDELRLLLGIAGKYARWDAFKAYIKKAITELNEVSDIKVSFLQKKRGRSVVGLEFHISEKQPDENDIIDVKTDEIKLRDELIKVGLSSTTATKLARKAAEAEKVERISNKLPKMVENAKAAHATVAKYVTGAVKAEVRQLNLFDDTTTPAPGQTLKSIPPAWSV